jgi:hypothetical protein
MDSLAKRKSHRSMGWLNLGFGLDKTKATRSGGLISKDFYHSASGMNEKARSFKHKAKG